jgi:ABC-type dipeptide/oligopeptide/nickel transport system ATPase component
MQAVKKATDAIEVRGARTHNLKNISFSLPVNKLTVVTGVSGSGKSSLAFDTIYAEGQRRYVESLSAYARQFLERMDKPDVDEILGIAPAIAVGKRIPRAIRVQPLPRRRKFTITCGFFSPASVELFATFADAKSKKIRPNQPPMKFYRLWKAERAFMFCFR